MRRRPAAWHALALALLAVPLAVPTGLGVPPPSGVPGNPLPIGPSEPADGLPNLLGTGCEDLLYKLDQSLGSTYTRDASYSVAVSPDGARLFVTGDSYPGGQADRSDYVTMAHDAVTGATLWVARYNGPADDQDHPYSVSVAPDGATVFVTGWSVGEGTKQDFLTIAYDAATGAERWTARYDGPGHGDDFGWAARPAPDGSAVFVTGISRGTKTGDDWATVAYDAATGALRWEARHDGPDHQKDWPYLLAVDPAGARVYVEGWEYHVASGQDYAVAAYDAATGAELWVARDGGPSMDVASDVTVTPDGALVVATGWSTRVPGATDLYTIALDSATGARVWSAAYDGPAAGAEAWAFVKASPDGRSVYVTGSSTGIGTGFDYATVAYDAATGAQRWATRFDGRAHLNDLPMGLEVTPDGGTLFVTGCTTWPGFLGTPGIDYGTLAYDAATGAPRWGARYDGPDGGGDAGWGIAMGPRGDLVYVTGWSEGIGTGYDFATLAYRTDARALAWVARADEPGQGERTG